MDVSTARIILRPIGSPLTIGMSGLAVASFVESGLDLHWIAARQAHPAGLILLSVPFVLQLLASVISYLARDGATGAAVGLLGATWGAVGLIQLTSRTGSHPGAEGLLLLAAGGVLAASAFAIAVSKPLPGLVFGLAALRFLASGVFDVSKAGTYGQISGVIGLVVVAVAGYCVLALELEGVPGGPKLPTGRRRPAASAVQDDLSAQLEGIANEPGVRRTT